jgi:cytochrome bd-type quinol oxidase subunit 2
MSLAFVATLVTAAAGTLFPYLLPAFPAGRGGISIFSTAPSPVALTCALTVTLGGIVIVGIYTPIVWRRMGGKLRAE